MGLNQEPKARNAKALGIALGQVNLRKKALKARNRL
jgi:hypothetical protein